MAEVPTVCILWHMMHLRSRDLSKHHKPSTEEDIPDIPRAKIGGDSADEAYEVLTNFLEDGTVTYNWILPLCVEAYDQAHPVCIGIFSKGNES